MKMLLSLLILLASLASASPLPDYPFVYVSETASKELAPDRAKLFFEIATRDKAAEVAFEQQTKTARAIIAFALSLGLAEKDLISQPIEKVDGQNYHRDQGDRYYLSREVTITVKDLTVYPPLLEFLYKQDHVLEIRADFERADQEKLRDELLKEACAQALKKAETLAAGFSRKVKGVKAISEQGFDDFVGNFGLPAGSRAYAAGGGGGHPPGEDFRVVPETLKFSRTVYAICELE